jgi:hypothetical protein
VLFPDAFRHFYPLLDDGWAFLIYGRVEDDLGALAISVERLVPVSRRTEEPGAAEVAGPGERVTPERPPVFMWGREHAAVPAH